MSRVIDLNDAFPLSRDGKTRGPLPKQQQFLDLSLAKDGAKYIAYVGGVGSGKTLIGCITLLSWAVYHGGDYLVARQFMPELRDTTYKTFLELCPPELIVEHRVADAILKVRSLAGPPATIFFRGLEEPDKLRSLNLSGFHIDEANQVSEDAFLLLQGRLRNKAGLRKGILTTNPKGHDWIYRWFVKKDHLKSAEVKAQFAFVHAPSTENVHLPEGYVETMLSAWSEERIQREVMGSFEGFEGAVYPEFRRDVHVIKPFAIPETWTKVIGIDHGFRNPAAWVWGATDYDGNLYIYREFYEKEWLIEQICRDGKDGRKSAVSRQVKGEKIEAAYIDPSTGNRRGADGRSDLDWYHDALPSGFPLMVGNNAVAAGIDRVKSLLKKQSNGKPRLFIFDTCGQLIEEMANYRYMELRPGQQGKTNEKEQPLKVNDHACLVGSTQIAIPGGTKRLDEVRAGDLVLTTLGARRVLVAACTGAKPVYRHHSGVTGTLDHPVLTVAGKIPLGELTPRDTPVTLKECQSKSFLIASFFARLGLITAQTAATASAALGHYIEWCGSTIGGLYHRSTIYTILTGIRMTTASKILSACPQGTICRSTLDGQRLGGAQLLPAITSSGSARSPSTGMRLRPAPNGTGNMLSALLRRGLSYLRFGAFVRCVIARTLLKGNLYTNQDIATQTVEQLHYAGVEKVYNLHVEGVSEFFADGVLVSNCDAFRYLVMSLPETEPELDDIYKKVKYESIEGALYRDLDKFKNPKKYRDDFGDF